MATDGWIWVKNEAVNNIPGRIPEGVRAAWEARGWVECPEPSEGEVPDLPARAPVKPSKSGQEEEKDNG